MSITTKTGDTGQTRLLYGDLISKGDLQVEAYGTIDEMNSALGLARSLADDDELSGHLEMLQRESFIVGSELATPPDHQPRLKQRVTPAMTAHWEEVGNAIERTPGLLDDWALPGATPAGAAVDVARTVTRRAERCAVRLADVGGVPNTEIVRYLNRVSDLLWLLGREYEIKRSVNGALRTT